MALSTAICSRWTATIRRRTTFRRNAAIPRKIMGMSSAIPRSPVSSFWRYQWEICWARGMAPRPP